MADMIVDRAEDRLVPREDLRSRVPALIQGVERRVEGMGTFGPIRTVQRRFLAEYSEDQGYARRIREAREECQSIMQELRRVCEYTQEREAW